MSSTASVTENLADYESDDLRLDLRWWDALNYLTVGQIYLQGNALLREPLAHGAHQAAAARPLGHQPRPLDDLRPAQPAHQPHRLGLDLRHRPGARRTGTGRRRIPRGHLLRGLPAHHRRRRRRPAAVPAVLLPRRDPQPRQRADTRQHPRGRRARVCAGARRRGGHGPPGPLRRLRRRRRRGRDRTPLRLVEAADFLNPRRDGAVLPILHLNGYKIAGPTVLGRTSDEDVEAYLRSQGWDPVVVEGDDPRAGVPRRSARPCVRATSGSWRSRPGPRRRRPSEQIRHRWPAIVLRTPKGWTGPHVGRRHAGRGHQPAATRSRCRGIKRQPGAPADPPGVAARPTGPTSSSTTRAGSCRSCAALAPDGDKRMSATPLRQRRTAAAPSCRSRTSQTYGAGRPSTRGRRLTRTPARWAS